MPYSGGELRFIFDKTGGHCYYCRKRLAWSNYGVVGARGAWEVDHSKPRSRGGTEYLRNLVPSCVPCNRSKGSLGSREYQDEILFDTLLRHPERFPELLPKKKRLRGRRKRP
ncbi:MAG TPA: HNH endonuclease [Dehalococcoidia bacterium]|jgi:5-methylcytosine-specific restriction endonuclease McrA|nr:HNH endonuclease [Dehalococcoidia bacterium]